MPKEKKGKEKKPVLSYYEAIMGYKIGIKEKELEEIKTELSSYEEKNSSLKQRNERLVESRELNFNKALNEYRDFNKNLKLQKTCEKEEVESEMKDMWKVRQFHASECIALKKEIRKIDKEINNSKKEVKYWKDFKENGSQKLSIQIKLLKQELTDMNENHEIVSASLKTNLKSTIEQIQKNAEETILKKNKSAADKVFQDLDKKAVIMSKDNEWMQVKIDIFKKELDELKYQTSVLEKENIQLMSYLFDCNTDDLKCVKDGFKTQFLDSENLEENTILDVDLDQLESVRPKSGLNQIINKIKELEYKKKQESALAIEEDPDSSNYLKLGECDFKTLSLNGQRKELIKVPTPSQEEFKAQNYKSDEWPITHEMLYEALNSN